MYSLLCFRGIVLMRTFHSFNLSRNIRWRATSYNHINWRSRIFRRKNFYGFDLWNAVFMSKRFFVSWMIVSNVSNRCCLICVEYVQERVDYNVRFRVTFFESFFSKFIYLSRRCSSALWATVVTRLAAQHRPYNGS